MPDITSGFTFSPGDSCTAAKLNSLVDDATINNSAINEDKLAANAVTNAKVSASAAIAYSKLAYLGGIGELLVGNGDKVPTSVALSGDITTVSAAGLVTIADDAITTDKILDANITGPKIAMTDDARGDILIRGAANYERLAKPTTPAGEVLTFAASATDPAWVAPISRALNFEQIVLSGTSYVYNNLASATNTPLYGTAGQDDAWYLVDDTQGGGGTGMATTSGFTITEGNKVRISMTLHIDCQASHIPVVGKVQRKNGSSGAWGDLYPNSVGDASSTRIQAAFISNALAHGRGISNVCFSFIDDPTLDESGSAVIVNKDEPFYRVIYSVHRDRYIYLNRDAYYEATTEDTITYPPEYRLASTLIVEEIQV